MNGEKKSVAVARGSDRRTLRGLFVKPREQLRYSLMFMSGGMVVLTLFIGIAIYSLNGTILSIEAAYGLDPEVVQMIRGRLNSTLIVTLLVSAVLSGFAFLLGIQLSHRIYGPLVPLQRHIGELMAGNFASRVKLRTGDEMIELQDSLNELALTFENKYGSRKSDQV